MPAARPTSRNESATAGLGADGAQPDDGVPLDTAAQAAVPHWTQRISALGVRPGYHRFNSDGPDPELISSLYAQTPAALVGHTLGVLALVTLFWSWAPHVLLMAWLLLFAAVWGLRVAAARRFVRSRPTSLQAHRRWQHAWNATSLACGGVWSLAVALFYDHGNNLQSTALILLVYSYCIGSPATSYRVFVAYALMCFLPMVVHVAADGLPTSLPMAGLITGGFLVTVVIGRQYRHAFGELLALKAGNGQLAEQLGAQKAAAEAARAAAEEANRAKTRFFAAASHDLRQPLHALALFAQTLLNRSRDDDTAALARSIADSVEALEGLFGELMDLSRIDAGGVEPQPRSFALAGLYARLKLHFEPQAFDKGLALRFRGAGHWAHADPVLVERIVRNLLSNAIRYTEDGGVLVGCRRRGDRLLLQVWDSGIGIRAEALPRIFDEFYQVGSGRTLQPQHRKGSGLGLAIVRRLAQLMSTPLEVRSTPQRGTVFTLSLPMGPPQEGDARVPEHPAMPAQTLAGCHLLVVDDDAAVRSATRALLEGWQAQVTDLDSLADLEAWLDSPDWVPPDLLIVDQHLPEGRSGQEVVRRLRRALGAALPVIMVTGHAQAQDEQLARAADYQLLYKPVPPNRLRVLIGHLLARRASPASPADPV